MSRILPDEDWNELEGLARELQEADRALRETLKGYRHGKVPADMLRVVNKLRDECRARYESRLQAIMTRVRPYNT